MKPYIYTGSRECHMDSPRYRAYYGQNETDPLTSDYCFVVWKNGKEVFRVTNAQLLDVACGESPKDVFIAGLSMYLSR
jgi:hypothetical protein